MTEAAGFYPAETGMTRFPPNVEQITVEISGPLAWLIARRNETVLRFPIEPKDCDHLISLLARARDAMPKSASLVLQSEVLSGRR